MQGTFLHQPRGFDSFGQAASSSSVKAALGENPELTQGNDLGDTLRRSNSFKETNI
jgi:hypothetical protein